MKCEYCKQEIVEQIGTNFDVVHKHNWALAKIEQVWTASGYIECAYVICPDCGEVKKVERVKI